MAPDGRRHVGFAALVIPFSMAILIIVIATSRVETTGRGPATGLLLAFDHSVFIGVITNILSGSRTP